MLADVQALTDNYDNPAKVRESIREVVMDYLAVGIDPHVATIFIQSQIPVIAELTIFYANLVTVARLSRNPTVKTEIAEKSLEESLPLGFFMYPVSQAADITCMEANLVPVGKDQAPMIEQCQEIVDKFNTIYGQTLTRPEGLYGEIGRLVGTDGNTKMSKSLNNAIFLSDPPETVNEKIRRMYTDPKRIHPTDPGTVAGNPVFIYHDAFNGNGEEIKDLKERYEQGRVGDVEVKQKLAEALNCFLDPIRENRRLFNEKPEDIDEIVHEGTKKARLVAEETMSKVREAMKLYTV